jgi:hypothetical protein
VTTLASVEDVNRILGHTTGDNPVRDAKVRASLDAVESWAEGAFWKTSAEGPQVEVYFDVYEDATLYLPALDITVTKVKIVPYAAGDDAFYYIFVNSEAGNTQGYDVTDDGRLILRPLRSIQPFEGVRADRILRTYSRVEVFYKGTGIVPRGVTEGVAFLAAGYHTYGPRVLGGLLQSEKIGDYSYTLSNSVSGEALPYMQQANFFLGRFMRKQRVRVM